MTSPSAPLYHQIYLVLREQIAEGHFEDGKLPSEVELADTFGVSRITMRKALDRLVAENAITRRRGAGSFVNAPAPARRKERVGGLLEDIINHGLVSRAHVLDFGEVVATAEVAELLEVPPGERVLKVSRVRSYQGRPLSYITTYVPREIGAHLKRSRLEHKPMLTLLEEAGVQVTSASQVLSARLADTKVAPLLEVDIGAPLLFVQRVVRGVQGGPVQLLWGLYRPDLYEYRMELSRAEGDKANIWVSQQTTIHSGPVKKKI
ncbi:MAG: GntR family transcriptional regulator [Burkholderiales bacterium]|nr:GntR family transcriptional regulator [Burkholderiales bacterium]ODU77330.1 MAG: hypothetical protein ABT00_14280 [Bordetella sp. SCN 68-11]